MFDAATASKTDELVQLARLVAATGYAFVTPTPASHARVLARPGSPVARCLRDVFGWSKPFAADTLSPDIAAAMQRADVLVQAGAAWRSQVRLSTLDGLLFLHSAYPTDASGAVFFGPDTYRFAQAIGGVLHRPVGRAVDIGCGAGVGAILIAQAHRAAEVIAADINPAALRFTEANATLAGVQVAVQGSDLLSAVAGQFDLIVANPPYMIDPAARAYRHGGGEWGAGLSLAIVEAAIERLAPGGTLLLYTGAAIVEGHDPFAAAAADRLAGSGLSWTYREADPDVFGEELASGPYVAADRIAAVVLTAHKGG